MKVVSFAIYGAVGMHIIFRLSVIMVNALKNDKQHVKFLNQSLVKRRPNVKLTTVLTKKYSMISSSSQIQTSKAFTDNFSSKCQHWSDIEQYLNLPDNDPTKQYIMQFPDKTQRDMIAVQLSYCPYTPLCNYTLNEYRSDSCCRPCSCLSTCTDYNNCCPDMRSLFTNRDDTKIKHCLPLQFRNGRAVYTKSVFGRKRCPRNANDILISKCEQSYKPNKVVLKDMIPVMHRKTYNVYRNMYCAFCNGVFHDEIDFFEPHFECAVYKKSNDDVSSIQYIKSNEWCQITFKYRNMSLLSICPGSISSCNVTGRWVHYDPFYAKACDSYTSTIQLDGDVFQNIHCALCNGISNIPRLCRDLYYKLERKSFPYAFSGILNIASEEEFKNQRMECPVGHFYDNVMKMCPSIRCSPYRQFVNGKCEKAMRRVNKRQYELVVRLKPESTHRLTDADRLISASLTDIHNFLQRDLPDATSFKIDVCKTRIILSTNKTCGAQNESINASLSEHIVHWKRKGLISSYNVTADNSFWLSMDDLLTDILVNLIFIVANKHNPDEIYDKLSQTTSFTKFNKTGDKSDAIVITIVNGFKGEFDHFSPTSFRHAVINDLVGMCSNISNTIIIPYNDFSVGTCLFMYERSIAVTSMISCLLVEIISSAYPWVLTRDGIVFTENQLRFNHTQIYIDEENGTLFLCQDQYQMLVPKSATTDSKLTFDHIISIVCVTLSIISLIFTLITYSILKPLRSLPGKNIMSLTASLLIAQVSYLVGSFSRFGAGSVMCKAFGILTHFSFLLAIFWMNICTLHMFRVLTKTRRMIQTYGNKTFIFYHTYCFSLASLCVTANILISLFLSESPSIGYGVDTCFISSRILIMITFALPLLLVIISNCVLFLYVIVYIKSTRVAVVQSKVHCERNDIAVLARLSTLTGMTWIFGLLHTWTGVYAFSILFIIFSAGQGLFIFISFVCNKRVLTVARGKMVLLRTSTQTSSLSL